MNVNPSPGHVAALALFAASPVWATYSCSVTATNMGVLYSATTAQDTIGTVTLNCTRNLLDASAVSFSIMATDGNNATAANPYRRVRRGATNNRLAYSLRRGVAGNLTCNTTSNWRAPPSTELMTGTISFGTALAASVTRNFCIRLPGTAGGNPAAPTGGIYTDTFNVYAQYPSSTGPLTPQVPVTYTVGVNNHCVFNTFPQAMVFSYTSFSTVQTLQRTFNLRCSTSLPWSISISPAAATMLGLNYTVTPSPTSGTGNGANQLITITGTIPANQAGTCATATCSVTNAHVVTITY
jgi:spore coat protein U-like protein